MTDLLEAVQIRSNEPGDKRYVISTWLDAYNENSYFAKRIRPKIFFKNHRRIVEGLLADPKTHVLCAVYKEAPEVLLGYLVYSTSAESPVIHFAFIKKEFCRMGLFRALLQSAGIQLTDIDPAPRFSHWTLSVNWIMNKYPHLIYDPYLAFEPSLI